MPKHQPEFTVPRKRLLDALRGTFAGQRGELLGDMLSSFGAERLSDLTNDHLLGLLTAVAQMSLTPQEIRTGGRPSDAAQLM